MAQKGTHREARAGLRGDAKGRVIAMEQKATLVLENGMVFEGSCFGAVKEVVGELVFTTAMTGYLETLTDPSMYGQIVVQTFPLIGNVGVIPSDFESETPVLKAYIVRDWCQEPSNFRCEGDLDTFLKAHGVVGLYGVDTRALTRIVRESGVMNAKILTRPVTDADMAEMKAYRVERAVKAVGSAPETVTKPEGETKRRVVLWNFGAKKNIERELLRRGCEVTAVPAGTTAEHILSLKPDGLMLSNGPGDPMEDLDIVEQLRLVCEKKIPTFGICLGHQLLALSQGAKTEKLKYGHRGANQPAVQVSTGRVFITSQNHGYVVVNDSLPENAAVSFINANDGTCEGIAYKDMPAFSVQFHPEAAAGPLDTAFLFDEFMERMDKENAR